MKKGIIGILITIGTFILLIFIFKILGGDQAQSHRSDWFPLAYIIPVMAGLFFYFFYKEKQE